MLKSILPQEKWQYLLAAISFVVLFVFSAFRDGVGTDYKNYELLFYDYLNSGDVVIERLEPGFKLIFEAVSFFSYDSRLFFVITSFLILFFYFFGFLKYSRSLLLSIFLFVTLYYYFNSLNTVRQFVAMALIFCFSTRYLAERNLSKYLISVAFASLFHLSALVMLPAYWLCKKMSFRAVILLFISFPIFFLSYDFFSSIIFKIIPSYQLYSDYETGSSNAFIIIQMIFLIFVFIAYKYNKNWSKVELVSFNFSLISFFLYILSYKNIMFFRVAVYFGMYLIILVPAVLNNVKKNSSKVIFYIVCIFLGIVNLVYHLYQNVSGILPYKIIF